ncbi:MAG TPA: hypothetical protein VKE96_21320 [Vicinamibacterales bacterium]|nr:hypothetical protein [Vicinamibacterales bacterium]
MADQPSDTKSVVVTLILDSASSAPYAMSGCEGTIYHVDGSKTTFSAWETEKIGTPISGGAEFALLIKDTQNESATRTSVANWVVTFIPRGDVNTVPGSPFSGKSSFSGTGAVMFLNDFLLDLKNAKIQKRAARYSWDWTVAVQIVTIEGTKCFVSDPQMDVDQLELTDEQLEQLDNLLRKLTRAATKPARSKQPANKKGGKRRSRRK